jgi:hypothetical protein
VSEDLLHHLLHSLASSCTSLGCDALELEVLYIEPRETTQLCVLPRGQHTSSLGG